MQDTDRILISVVSPVYMAEATVFPLVSGIIEQVSSITDKFEIILVEDGSPDNSWEKIVQCCEKDSRVKGVKLSRNFGQHNAITAGLDISQGEWVVVMDCDLQDNPEEITNLYHKALDGYEIVLAKRKKRKDNFLKKAGSWLFYKILSYLTGIKQDSLIANFGIYHRKVIDVLINEMRENIRYFPMMIRWMGFRFTAIDVEHGDSGRKKSSYTLRKLLDLAFNVMLTFSDKPLRLTIQFGLILTLLALIYGIYTIYRMFTGEIEVEGWTSIIVSIWFIGGVIIFILGVIGLYLGKTFEEVKKRPIYIVQIKHNV